MTQVKQTRRFLTAEWRNLVMLNYSVDPSLLQPRVPPGTTLDSFDGNTYVSLVGFQFNRTHVCGIRALCHQSFDEINLRFYVRRVSKRGVVFIKELVPKRAVALIARRIFNENYFYVPMSHHVECGADGAVQAEYRWGTRREQCSLQIETDGHSFLPAENSLSQFITEHYWGYAAQRDGTCLEYEVQHHRWKIQNAIHACVTGNLADTYGDAMANALNRQPDSAFLAEGSRITVFQGSRID